MDYYFFNSTLIHFRIGRQLGDFEKKKTFSDKLRVIYFYFEMGKRVKKVCELIHRSFLQFTLMIIYFMLS